MAVNPPSWARLMKASITFWDRFAKEGGFTAIGYPGLNNNPNDKMGSWGKIMDAFVKAGQASENQLNEDTEGFAKALAALQERLSHPPLAFADPDSPGGKTMAHSFGRLPESDSLVRVGNFLGTGGRNVLE